MIIDTTMAIDDKAVKEKAAHELNVGSDYEVAGRIYNEDMPGAIFAEGKLWLANELHVWTEVPAGVVSKLSQRFDGALYPETAGGDKKTKTYKINAAKSLSIFKTLCNAVADPEFFRSARVGCAFRDTFVSAAGAEPLTDDHRARFAFDFEFIQKAEPPKFCNFLIETFYGQSEQEVVDRATCLGEFAGACMLGRATDYQKAIMLIGSGANGKSVFLDVLRACMPSGSVACLAPQHMAKEQHLVALAGKLCNIVPEIEETEVIRSGEVKSVISGDQVTARGLYQDSMSFSPVAGHIFSANAMPRSDDRSQGFWRRWVVIRFPNFVAEKNRNPRLAREIIAEEKAQIVSWFVSLGIDAAARGDLTVPASSREELGAWRRDTDQVSEFAAEMLENPGADVKQTEWLEVSSVYESYKQWAEGSGHKRMLKKNLLKGLGDIGFAQAKVGATVRLAAQYLEPAKVTHLRPMTGGRR